MGVDINKLADLVLSQQGAINRLAGQNAAFRVALTALIVSHPNKQELAARFDALREASAAKSLFVAADDSVLAFAEQQLDELAKPWRSWQ